MVTEKSLFREYLEALLIAVIFATFARTYVVQAFKIPSGSMEQNLLIGDHILVNKFIYGPTVSALERKLLPVRSVRRGDIVVFKVNAALLRGPEGLAAGLSAVPGPDGVEAGAGQDIEPERDFIKRCMGLPGDSVELLDKRLFLNGRLVHDEAFTYHTDDRILPRSPFGGEFKNRDNFGPRKVPPAHYFCMGDNRDNSNDSRFWGEVPAGYVRGRACLIYWSLDMAASPDGDGEVSPMGPPGGWRERLSFFARIVAHRFTHTRWERTLRVVR